MLHRPSFARAGAAALCLSLAALLTGAFASCSSADVPNGPGATCTTNADCASTLRCTDSVCTDPGGAGGGGATSSSASSSSATTSTGTGQSWGACDTCVEMQCAAEQAACDGECLAIQGCLETVCANLSAIGEAAEEGKCQVRCQDDHPDGEKAHLAFVNCADASLCSPPCTFYPQDYEECRSFMSKGACSALNQACKDSSECQTYKDCVTTCKTNAACLACDDSESGLAGRKVLEAYELCVAGECLAAAWLP